MSANTNLGINTGEISYFSPMESQRQKRISELVKRDLAEILQKTLLDGGHSDILISVTKVVVTKDLSSSKVFLSIFPQDKVTAMMAEVNKLQHSLRYELAQRTRNQLRRVPDLHFQWDDSLDYMEKLDNSLRGKENPVKQPELLHKRKKT